MHGLVALRCTASLQRLIAAKDAMKFDTAYGLTALIERLDGGRSGLLKGTPTPSGTMK
ncbi:MAG: hypothetical protein JO031_03250 [Ktedonobacteraceae bacterium]|nr:hypothetical protein [Ktedonobacteraceae bacterium]